MTDQPRRFHLQRNHDVTGVSGTGRVADGVQWPDGTVTVRWQGTMPSTVNWNSTDHAVAVHGHGGHTQLVWDDPAPGQPTAEQQLDAAYRERAYLLAWLAALHPASAVIAPALDVDEEEGWQLLFLVAGGWQMTWHIAPTDAPLFDRVEHVDFGDPRAAWDGHTTAQKYRRIRSHTGLLQMQRQPEPASKLPEKREQEQGAPVDWRAVVRDRERELKTVGEARHRAEAALTRVRQATANSFMAGPNAVDVVRVSDIHAALDGRHRTNGD